MAEEELRENREEDVLEEVWDDRSLWNEEDIGDSLTELDRWDDMVKDLLPKKEPPKQEEPVQEDPTVEPAVELKAVKTKPKPAVTQIRTPEPEKAPALPVSDRELLMLIQKYKEADKICQMARMTLQDLQHKVARLSYRLKKYIDVEGLYRDTGPLKMTQTGIHIPKGHLVDTGFNAGDVFKVGFKDDLIILARQAK